MGFAGHEENHQALLRGDLHLYAEYVGTALRRYLNLAPLPRDQVLQAVRKEARVRWNLEWLHPIGFDNTYGFLLPAARAASLGVRSISDLASHAKTLTLGATADFFTENAASRFAPGGYEGFQRRYGFAFARTVPVDTQRGATFAALQRGEIDLILDFVVSPYIEAVDLVELEDDRELFPAYYLAPVVRGDLLAAYPAIRSLLDGLAGTISNREMARLNYAMEFQDQNPSELARAFLASHSRQTS